MSYDIEIQPFITLLRKSGLDIPIDSAILSQRIVNTGYFSSSEEKLRQTLKSIIIKRREEFEIFDICFDIFFVSSSTRMSQRSDVSQLNDNPSNTPTNNQSTSSSADNTSQMDQQTLLEQFGDHRSDIASESQMDGAPGNIGGGMSEGTPQNQSIAFYTRWLPSDLQEIATTFLSQPEQAWNPIIQNFIDLLFGYGQYRHVQTIAQRYTRYASFLTRAFSQLMEEINQDENFTIRIKNMEEMEFLRERIIEFLRKIRLTLLQIPELDSKQLLRQFYSATYLPKVQDYLQKDFNRIEGDMEKVQAQLLYLGKKIAVQEKRKRIRARYGGKINFRRTIRKNISNGGHILTLSHQKKKIIDPKIILLSDVSGSTEWVSEFFFIITYAAQSTFKKLMLFEFDNTTVEITKGLQSPTLSKALQKRIDAWQSPIRPRAMHSNYHTSFIDFEKLGEKYFSKHTSVLILGDCRDWMGGYEQNATGEYEPESKVALKRIIAKNKRVIILNPEPPERWNSGDSIVQHFKEVGAEVYHVDNLYTLMNFVFKHQWYS